MRTTILLCLLVTIAACSSSEAPPPATSGDKSTLTTPPGPPTAQLESPDCSTNEGRSKDLCNFEIAVNGTVFTLQCLESHTECRKDRDYATCLVEQKSFGCRDGKERDLAACDAIVNTSIQSQCRLYTSFAYDDISQCHTITDTTVKDVCLQGFLDRHIDCTYINYPCRTTHTLQSEDCVFNDTPLSTACNGIAAQDEKRCSASALPICDFVFIPTFSYSIDGKNYSSLLQEPELDGAMQWIKDHTPTDAVILANWDHGHTIRSATGRAAVAYNTPVTFQPGPEDAKTTFSLGNLITIKDLPYYDAERYGPQASAEDGALIASVLTATDPTTAVTMLKEHNIDYVLTTITDLEALPLLAALAPFDETQTPLIDSMNNLAFIDGFLLMYNDSTTSIYKVE
ncbi:hypothetical protein HY641_00690 [Candidatus Woesearchaeota archaeon]|nr:hypothetical protein [Candidatus Woesearchaeota archaeon]